MVVSSAASSVLVGSSAEASSVLVSAASSVLSRSSAEASSVAFLPRFFFAFFALGGFGGAGGFSATNDR